MPISSITITQKNTTDACNLLSVHNPLMFLIDVVYSSTVPDVIYVGIFDSDDVLLDTFAAIPYEDSGTTRTFSFIADSILRGFMEGFDDFQSAEKTLEYVDGITKEFKLIFYDPDDIETNDEIEIVAIHAARQFGEDPCLLSIASNVNETYYAAEGKPVYLYFYNDNESNVITVGTGEIIIDVLLDYDDLILFDFDDIYLTAL
jgi:hypothetical protein